MILTLPNAKGVKDLLEGMLGREVDLDPGADRMSPVDATGGLVATYCDDTSTLRAILGWSVTAGANIGCCIGLIPPAMAKEMVTERALRHDAVENLAEVSNVMAAVFDAPSNPHVRMDRTFYPSGRAPGELTTYLFTHYDRLDFDLTVKGYGTGKMSLVVCG